VLKRRTVYNSGKSPATGSTLLRNSTGGGWGPRRGGGCSPRLLSSPLGRGLWGCFGEVGGGSSGWKVVILASLGTWGELENEINENRS